MRDLAVSSKLLIGRFDRQLLSPQFTIDPVDQIVAGFVALAVANPGDVAYIPPHTRAAVDRLIIGTVGSAALVLDQLGLLLSDDRNALIEALRVASRVSISETLAQVVETFSSIDINGELSAASVGWGAKLAPLLGNAREHLANSAVAAMRGPEQNEGGQRHGGASDASLPSRNIDPSEDELILTQTLKDLAIDRLSEWGRCLIRRLPPSDQIAPAGANDGASLHSQVAECREGLGQVAVLGKRIGNACSLMTIEGGRVYGSRDARSRQFEMRAVDHTEALNRKIAAFADRLEEQVRMRGEGESTPWAPPPRPVILGDHYAITRTFLGGGDNVASRFSYSVLFEVIPGASDRHEASSYATPFCDEVFSFGQLPAMLRVTGSPSGGPLKFDVPLISRGALLQDLASYMEVWRDASGGNGVDSDAMPRAPGEIGAEITSQYLDSSSYREVGGVDEPRQRYLARMLDRLVINIDRSLREADRIPPVEATRSFMRLTRVEMLGDEVRINRPPQVSELALPFAITTCHDSQEFVTVAWLGVDPVSRFPRIAQPEIQSPPA